MPSSVRNCAYCGQANAESKCSRCKSVFYCSRECELIDWKFHKNICGLPEQAAPIKVVPDHPVVREVMSDTAILSTIFAFFDWKGILRARICTKWRDAAKITTVPESVTDETWRTPELYVENRAFAQALGWISDALPMVPSVNILFNLRKTEDFEIADGEDPAPSYRSTFGNPPPPVDITPIANFRHLQSLAICGAKLNGSYPFLFDFPDLRSLKLMDVGNLKWDLSMLSGVPKLEKLQCIRNNDVTGSLNNIRVLRETLVKLCISMCYEIEGDLMDLADFPLVKEVSLNQCNKIVGDIRDIGRKDFPSIEEVKFPDTVYGGDIPTIAEAPLIMCAWYILKKRNPRLFQDRRLSLPFQSEETYDNGVHHSREMPRFVEFVKAGPRLGWRWTNCVSGGSCEANWLDPAPSPSDKDYVVYLEELKNVEKDVEFYKGFFVPPTQEEHLRRNSEIPLDAMLQMYANRSFW